jgi:integrase
MTMARSSPTPDRWSWTAGEKGANRVRVFSHPKSGRLFLEWYEPVLGTKRPKARTRALGHSDREQAKADAEEWALKLRRGEVARTTPDDPFPSAPTLARPIRLGPLFDIYGQEVTPRKSRGDHDRCTIGLFTALWGRERVVDSLCERDWRRYIDSRRSGVLAPRGRQGRPVGDRVIEHDLRLLLGILNWATRQKDEGGQFWLLANPLRGQKVPTEKNPRQPVITEAQYTALLEVAPSVDPRFALVLVLCHETGHRLNSVCHLRWSDVDFDGAAIRWRAETDKSGKEHETPLSDVAAAALRVAQRRSATIGDGWVFPSRLKGRALRTAAFQAWWSKAAAKLETPLPTGCRFHGFRRKLATELVTEQLAVIQSLGGWSQPQVVVSRYQKVPLEVQREVLSKRRTG